MAGGRSYDLSAVDQLVVLGAGKASAEAAQALEQMLAPRMAGGAGLAEPLRGRGVAQPQRRGYRKACWRCGARTAATRSPGPRHPEASSRYGWAGRSREKPPRSAGCSRRWRGKREPAAHRGRGARVLVARGGECTVSRGPDANRLFGWSGPSQEAAVGAALALDGAHGIVAMFADTDGADGGTPIAGGLVDWSTSERARQGGMSLRKALVAHGATAVLEACGDAMVTGPTQTNANDLVLILIR